MDHSDLSKRNISLSKTTENQLEADPIHFLDVKAKEQGQNLLKFFQIY